MTDTMVWPTLQANDARALIRFLIDAFGFQENVVHGDGDQVDHAQLDWPLGGGIMLGSGKPGSVWSLKPGTFGAYVVTDDVDKLHERAAAAGAEILKPPFDTDYGSRDFTARDPEGNLWSFGTYRGESARVG
ncbi:putative glyoxalase superfamily protein PhnB [Actinoplanes lutulentus]|nr:VOC family protein [Actinoplanes lutulentus]MBB2942872.1 putative glyoxalase superfamily protein PhnB [Actinoplanes lutulentus]